MRRLAMCSFLCASLVPALTIFSTFHCYANNYDTLFKTKIELLKEKARQGDIDSLNDLAWRYRALISASDNNLKYGGTEAKEAFRFIMSHYQEGNATLEYEISRYYAEGIGVAKDIKESERWIEKSAQHNYPKSQYIVARQYINKNDNQNALIWLKKAARQGYDPAEDSLAEMYHAGTGVEKDCLQAIKLYQKSATSNAQQGVEDIRNDPTCQSALQTPEAKRILTPAPDLVNPTAAAEQYELASSYDDGGDKHIDYVKAKFWYEKAAAQDHTAAIRALAFMYEKGKGMKPDYQKAYELYKRSAAQGDVASQYMVKQMASSTKNER
jgi:hypothetical protein